MDKLIAHFVGLTHPFIVCQVTKAYMDHIYMLHGQPQYVISDRDGIFTSTLWKELFKPTGKPKRMNQYLEGYLPCFVHTNGILGSLLLVTLNNQHVVAPPLKSVWSPSTFWPD